MSLQEKENYSQDDQDFQNDTTQYIEDDLNQEFTNQQNNTKEDDLDDDLYDQYLDDEDYFSNNENENDENEEERQNEIYKDDDLSLNEDIDQDLEEIDPVNHPREF